eukprot:gene1110-460_t
MCEIDIDETRVKVIIDSGSTVNVIDETTFKKINNASRKRLKPTNHRIYAYGSDAPLPLSGTFEAILKSKDRVQTNAIMHIVSGNDGNLLGLDTALELGVLQIVNQTISTTKPETLIADEYQCLFEGMGKVKAFTQSSVMAYFDPTCDSEVIVDASPVGLGALLVQNGRAMVVDEVGGSMVTASNDEKTITRNSSHFKAISSETVPVTAVDDVHEMLDHRNEDAEDTLSSETTRPVRSRKPPGWLKDFVTD